MKKKILLSIAAAALITLTGCGSDSDSSSTSSAPKSSVKVVDAYVIGAKVCDAKGVCADTDGSGVATAAFDLNTTLTSKAGYIDVNNNAKIDSGVDIELPDTFELKAPAGSSVISPVTDLIANGADKAKLAAVLGVDENALLSDPIASNNINLAKAIQIVYALKSVGKAADLVTKVNDYTASTSQSAASQTDLPTFNQETNNQTTTEENISTEPATTDLPPMGRLAKASTDLPTFGETAPSVNNEQSTETNNTQSESNTQTQSQNTVTVTGGIEVLAQLAQEVAGDNEKVKALIQAVMNANVTNAAELESAVASVKKELVSQNEATQEAAENAQSEAQQAAENAQSEAEEAAENAQNEANETAENAESEANETAQSAQNEAQQAAENAQNESNETADNESENEEIQTPPSVPTDLPTF